jgi:hypothetical protein
LPSTPHHNAYAPPLALPMPIVSHPPSTVFVQPPVNPHHRPDSILQMSRPNSYTNLTSISEVPRQHYEDTVRPLTPSCPTKNVVTSPDVPPMYTHGYWNELVVLRTLSTSDSKDYGLYKCYTQWNPAVHLFVVYICFQEISWSTDLLFVGIGFLRVLRFSLFV